MLSFPGATREEGENMSRQTGCYAYLNNPSLNTMSSRLSSRLVFASLLRVCRSWLNLKDAMTEIGAVDEQEILFTSGRMFSAAAALVSNYEELHQDLKSIIEYATERFEIMNPAEMRAKLSISGGMTLPEVLVVAQTVLDAVREAIKFHEREPETS